MTISSPRTTGDEAPRLYPGPDDDKAPGGAEVLKRLFATADLPGLLRDGAHSFLTLLTTTGDHGDAAAMADGEALSRWWGEADDREEQFAHAFAASLLEGKAPSAGLREAFRRFRTWLIEVYLTMRRLGVAVAPEVGDVFDRLLATDLALGEARRAAGDLGPVSADLGALRAAAEAEAEERLTRAIMRPVRAARQKWYRDGLAAARREAEGRIDALPVYRAAEWLTNRRRLGDAPRPLPVLRLSRPILVERYGEAVLAARRRQQALPRAADRRTARGRGQRAPGGERRRPLDLRENIGRQFALKLGRKPTDGEVAREYQTFRQAR